MAIYTVILPATAQSVLHDGITQHIVEAASSAEALVAVKAVSTADMNVVWDQATVTALVQNLEGVVFTITVAEGTPEVMTYTGVADDLWSDVATALQTACNVPYTSTWTAETEVGLSGTLKIADGTADTLGDMVVTVSAIGPNAEVLTDVFFTNLVHDALASADLSVDILSTCPTPRVIGSYK